MTEPSVAEAVIWANPRDPQGLKRLLRSIPDVRWVQLPFAGIEAFFDAGVIVPGPIWTCAKGIYGPATAEHALTLMLAAARRVHEHVRNRSWSDRQGFGAPERRLADQTVLIVGTGGIGSSLAPLLEPLGARMIAVNRTGAPFRWAERTEPVDRIGAVLPEADHVVIAAPLTKETYRMFDKHAFALMKPSAWLINVARGALVDTDDLVAALRQGRLGGAALDVTDPEPLPDRHSLWKIDDVIVTPHVANTWDMAFPELSALVSRNVALFARNQRLEGEVDVRAGY